MENPTIDLDGKRVLARQVKGKLYPMTFSNSDQAQKKIEKLGSGWYVCRYGPFIVPGRPFCIVAK